MRRKGIILGVSIIYKSIERNKCITIHLYWLYTYYTRIKKMEFIKETNRIYATNEEGMVVAEITYSETGEGDALLNI